ncbi:MAG: hypothetical protein WDO18_21030 [Acidobacteriota bacterium]
MLVFPQLTTGAAALYPLRRSRRRRTVANALGDGRLVRYRDPDFGETRWQLDAVGLSETELGRDRGFVRERAGAVRVVCVPGTGGEFALAE